MTFASRNLTLDAQSQHESHVKWTSLCIEPNAKSLKLFNPQSQPKMPSDTRRSLSERRGERTGLFWTKLCEKMGLERSLGYAEEEVQRGADRGGASLDSRRPVARLASRGRRHPRPPGIPAPVHLAMPASLPQAYTMRDQWMGHWPLAACASSATICGLA